MIETLLFPLIVWSVIGAGRTLADGLRLPQAATRLERNLVAYGLGIGLLAYGLLLLGLVGLLYPLAGLLWVVVLGFLGGRQHGLMVQELRAWRPGRIAPLVWLLTAIFLALGLCTLVGVYAPPVVFLPGINATEWDSISYHLADPKIFLILHRIVSLPWQPHSNFAFTTEMWFTLGLMAHGSVPLAKCFSWAAGAGAALGTYAIGSRRFGPRTGALAALLFAATPLAFWEAGTAYVDGATALYATFALLCVLNGTAPDGDRRWLPCGAALCGLALSTKATALSFVLLLMLGILAWEWQQSRSWRAAGLRGGGWALLALLVGSPWYLKSWICTGNPLYPYFYSLFGGHWWSAAQAAAYAAANNPGFGKSPSQALLAPWNVTMALVPGHWVGPGQPFNEFPTVTQSLPPVLLAALFFPMFGLRPIPQVVKALAIYALCATLLWFTQTQFVRFLLPIVPVYCLLTAWTLHTFWETRGLAGRALGLLAGLSVLWPLTVAFSLARAQAPVVFGQESRQAYLEQGDAGYDAMQFINTNLPRTAKIAFFGHPLGFYCDRSYVWADESTYVLGPSVNSPAALLARLQALGVTDVVVDLRSVHVAAGDGLPGWLYALTAAREAPLYPQAGGGNANVLVYALPSQP